MNEDIFQGKWKQFKGEVQKQWGKLTNDDVDVIEGERTKLEGRLQERYGYTKDEARREVDNFINNL
ncbi:MAG: CsbD family protein [Anaerolineae bacterium]|nr:CsbD family protein [Anaerolineae bacterium]